MWSPIFIAVTQSSVVDNRAIAWYRNRYRHVTILGDIVAPWYIKTSSILVTKLRYSRYLSRYQRYCTTLLKDNKMQISIDNWTYSSKRTSPFSSTLPLLLQLTMPLILVSLYNNFSFSSNWFTFLNQSKIGWRYHFTINWTSSKTVKQLPGTAMKQVA